jgi:hypothetical protein
MFIHVATQTYPLSYDDIRGRHPQISLSESIDHQTLSDLGYEAVNQLPYPSSLRADQYAEPAAPNLQGGKWVRGWNVFTYSFTGQVDENEQPIPPEQAKAVFAEQVKANLRAQLAAHRYKVETSGVTMPGGTIIRTDRESQATITGAYTTSLLNPSVVIDWKGANGWVQINAAQIAAIASAVTQHVQSCFSKEKQLSEKLDTLTPEQVFAFDVETEWNAL